MPKEKRRYIRNVAYGVFSIAPDRTVYQRQEDGALVKVTDEVLAGEVYQAALQLQATEGKRVRLPGLGR
ncbi:MAG TPA: hypothetical protein VFI96_08495 [Longimicrobiaceae bacterium]|nr:hypothetical protein [Longimicrobiaceae bacterium]